MVDKIISKLLWGLFFIGILAVALLAFGARAQTPSVYMYISVACIDEEVVIRLVQSKTSEERQKMYSAAILAGVCKSFPNYLNVVFRRVVAEDLIWYGDGEDDKMVVIEFQDVNGTTVFSWYLAETWYKLVPRTNTKEI